MVSELFMEMANYRKFDTGLPMNMWVDQGKTYRNGGHCRRIKVQGNKQPRIQKGNFISLDLEDFKYHGLDNAKLKPWFDLKENDLKKASVFAKDNAFALKAISDEFISESDFLKIMIRYDHRDSEELQDQEKQVLAIMETHLDSNDYDMDMIKDLRKFICEEGGDVPQAKALLDKVKNLLLDLKNQEIRVTEDDLKKHGLKLKRKTPCDLDRRGK